MSMFIASANTNTMTGPVKVVTAKDIAEKLGIKVSTVHRCFLKNPVGKAELVEKVRQTGVEMGYNARKARGHCKAREVQKPEKFYCRGNYHSREEEVTRMLALREEGFSNKQIAKRMGRAVLTVRRNIGAQPEDMTKANRVHGQEYRAAENARRKAYVQSHKVVEHNELVRKVNEVGDKLNANMAEFRALNKTHQELIAQVAAKEADIRKIAEKMGLEVVEVNKIPAMIPEKSETQLNFLN